MSKGDKVGITLESLMDEYHPDVIRYFFIRYAPENQYREFTWKDFIDANNNELVANLGNFINRVLTFAHTRFDGSVPEGKLDRKVKEAIEQAFEQTADHVEHSRFVKATESILELGHFANKFFNDEAPWESIKDDPKRAGDTIYNSLQLVNALRILAKPFLPFSSQTLSVLLSIEDEKDPNTELSETGRVETYSDGWVFEEIPAGTMLQEPKILFPKLEYTQSLQDEDSPEPETYVTTEDIPPGVSEVHEKVIIGEITQIQKRPDRPNLNIVTVETKEPTPRTIICGAPNIKVGDVVPVALEGAKVTTPDGSSLTVKEKELYGIVSQGMLCSQLELGVGEDHDGIWILPNDLRKFKGLPVSSLLPVQFDKDDALSDLPTAWAVFDDLTIK